MARVSWNNRRATSLRHALELCKERARAEKNLSVERIAEQMGLADHWILYKWIAEARMPAVMIPVYESVTGGAYITQWLASRSGQLIIPMPTGRKCDETDIQQLQALLHATTGALMQFYAGSTEAEPTLASIKNAMETLGWHHGNVSAFEQPQLEL